VVCVIADFLIGIDVEFIDHKIDYTEFQSQMTQNEFRRTHNSANKIHSFFEYWTEKEAVIKALGKGLFVPLESFEVIDKECLIEQKKFYLNDIFLAKDYICSVASNHKNMIQKDIDIEQFKIEYLLGFE